jgi:energy-coupling factor transporter ATP-binding protein EcfA2
MIQKVSIRNFKCLRDVRFDLQRFTVIVGPNASGKSSILQALKILCDAFSPSAIQIPQIVSLGQTAEPIEKLLSKYKSRGASDEVELAAATEQGCYRYRSGVIPGPRNKVRNSSNATSGPAVGSDLDSPDWNSPKPNEAPLLPTSVLLRLEASNLAVAHSAGPDPAVMTANGVGLHSALASMALNDPDSWQSLQKDLRKIIPTISRLRHSRAELNKPPSLLFDTIGAESLPALQVSEGTLLVLGLLAALHAPTRPNLILLDDLDRGLHPKAQKELVMLLRTLMHSNEALQIVATTHSPYLLDSMEPNEVRMTYLHDDGSTECASLTEHPDFERWKDEMAPGEMWSLFGEKWLIEQGAS